MSNAKKRAAQRDAAAEAVKRARKEGESDADYTARMKTLDATEETEDEAEDRNTDASGNIRTRIISGFTHHFGPTEAQIEAQRILRPGESDEQHAARMKRLDDVTVQEPVTFSRGQIVYMPPAEATKLGRMGLVAIGDLDEVVAQNGPTVLREAGLVRQTNG